MKRYLLILALCGAAYAGDYEDAYFERLEITSRLDEIVRQQKEMLRIQQEEAAERSKARAREEGREAARPIVEEIQRQTREDVRRADQMEKAGASWQEIDAYWKTLIEEQSK